MTICRCRATSAAWACPQDATGTQRLRDWTPSPYVGFTDPPSPSRCGRGRMPLGPHSAARTLAWRWAHVLLRLVSRNHDGSLHTAVACAGVLLIGAASGLVLMKLASGRVTARPAASPATPESAVWWC